MSRPADAAERVYRALHLAGCLRSHGPFDVRYILAAIREAIGTTTKTRAEERLIKLLLRSTRTGIGDMCDVEQAQIDMAAEAVAREREKPKLRRARVAKAGEARMRANDA